MFNQKMLPMICDQVTPQVFLSEMFYQNMIPMLVQDMIRKNVPMICDEFVPLEKLSFSKEIEILPTAEVETFTPEVEFIDRFASRAAQALYMDECRKRFPLPEVSTSETKKGKKITIRDVRAAFGLTEKRRSCVVLEKEDLGKKQKQKQVKEQVKEQANGRELFASKAAHDLYAELISKHEGDHPVFETYTNKKGERKVSIAAVRKAFGLTQAKEQVKEQANGRELFASKAAHDLYAELISKHEGEPPNVETYFNKKGERKVSIAAVRKAFGVVPAQKAAKKQVADKKVVTAPDHQVQYQEKIEDRDLFASKKAFELYGEMFEKHGVSVVETSQVKSGAWKVGINDVRKAYKQ
jgi:hypothetical protein